MEPCPRCGSKDNVGVYSDGKWCFGCGWGIRGYKGLSTADIRKQLQYEENKKKNDPIHLPADYRTTNIPSSALDWLRKYEITETEITKFHIGWSDEYERKDGTFCSWPSLIFPAFDLWGNLLVFQRRSHGAVGFPKYHTTGAPGAVLWTVSYGNNLNGWLVLVEDFVSCLKIGRQFETSPLWGSSLSLGQITRISDRYEKLVLWLDKDKARHASLLRMKALPFFKEVVVITTEKDPKDHSDLEIFTTIRENLD